MLTLLISVNAFFDKDDTDADKIKQITPASATRFAYSDDYDQILISSELGPQNDGKLDVIDAIRLTANEIDISGYDRVVIARIKNDMNLDSFDAKKIGAALCEYMEDNKVKQFATAAIADLDVGQDLHGKWNTLVLLRDFEGKWSFKNLGATSIQKSTSGAYAVLTGNKMAKIDGKTLVSTLLNNQKMQEIISGGGGQLEDGVYHLVRAPINQGGAYAVVGNGFQTVYNDNFEVIASGKTGFTVMPAIDADGTYIDGKVTTVSGKGNTWDVRNGIPAQKADGLGQAYGATA